MTEKFDRFIQALTELCLEHDVHLTTGGYEGLQVWNREGDHPLTQAGITDWTDPESKR